MPVRQEEDVDREEVIQWYRMGIAGEIVPPRMTSSDSSQTTERWRPPQYEQSPLVLDSPQGWSVESIVKMVDVKEYLSSRPNMMCSVTKSNVNTIIGLGDMFVTEEDGRLIPTVIWDIIPNRLHLESITEVHSIPYSKLKTLLDDIQEDGYGEDDTVLLKFAKSGKNTFINLQDNSLLFARLLLDLGVEPESEEEEETTPEPERSGPIMQPEPYDGDDTGEDGEDEW